MFFPLYFLLIGKIWLAVTEKRDTSFLSERNGMLLSAKGRITSIKQGRQLIKNRLPLFLFFVIRPDGPIIFLCQCITTIYCGITVYHQALCQHLCRLSQFYTRSGFNVHILDPLPNPPPLWEGNCYAGSWAVNVLYINTIFHLISSSFPTSP